MTRQEEPTTTKRAYTGLADYAAAHHAPESAYRRAGWYEKSHSGRPALAIPTDSGERYRYIDGRGSYINIPGYKPCLYGLSEALEIHAKTGLFLVFCNGEASTVTAQHYGLPAFTHTAGENSELTSDQLAQLQDSYRGPVIVALDSDRTGRDGAAKIVHQLQGAGYEARAVDLGGHDGCDLADFAGKHQHDAAAALAECPTLQLEAPRRGQVDRPPTPAPSGPKSPIEDEQEARALEAYVQAALRNEAAVLAATTSGRNNQLNNAALALGSLVGANWVQRHWIDETEAERALYDACITNGYIDEEGANAVRATFRSGFNAGLVRPREKPSRRELAHSGGLSQRFAAAVDVPPVEATSGESETNWSQTAAPAVSEISDIPPAPLAIVGSTDCAELVEENRRLQAREAAYIARLEALEAENAALREERDSLYARVDELEDTQAQVAKLWRHKHLDLKQRATLANLMQDTRGETRPDGKRAIPASSYRQMSDRYNIPVSTLQNAIRPLKAVGILQTEEQKRWDQDGEMLDHPITTDVTIVFDPAQLLPVFPLEPSKRAAATKANTEARQKELKDLAEIGRAIKEAKCPKCKKKGCMELYCSTYAEIIPQSMLEQTPQVHCTTPPAPAESPAPATGPGTLYPPKEKTGGTLYPSPQDGTGDRLAGKWKNPKPWAAGEQPSTATAAD